MWNTFITIIRRRSLDEKNRTINILVFFCLICLLPSITSAIPIIVPALLFNDISKVPGYQYWIIEPWKGWEISIISDANESLSQDFPANLGDYDRISYRAGFTRDLGMAYQITQTHPMPWTPKSFFWIWNLAWLEFLIHQLHMALREVINLGPR